MIIVNFSELQKNFWALLTKAQAGEEIVISYGKDKEIVARLVPHASPNKGERKLGILKGRFHFNAAFKMTEDEFLGS